MGNPGSTLAYTARTRDERWESPYCEKIVSHVSRPRGRVGKHVGQHTHDPSGQLASRSLHTAESFCKISDCLRESFTSRFLSSKDTTMYSIYASGRIRIKIISKKTIATDLISPEELISRTGLKTVPDVQELCDSVVPNVICIFLALVPRKWRAQRKQTHTP
jgi:hypothetical protein